MCFPASPPGCNRLRLRIKGPKVSFSNDMWSEGSFCLIDLLLRARFFLDKTCQAPKPQITAPDKQIRMAQYPAKPDIIKTGLKRYPDLCVGIFCFGRQLNERKTLPRAIPK